MSRTRGTVCARVGRGPAHNGRSISACFLPSSVLSRALSYPAAAPASDRHTPAAGPGAVPLGSKAALTRHPGLSHLQLSALAGAAPGGSPVLPSSGQALSPSSEAAEKVAASARSTSSVWLSPTAQPAWNSSRGSGAGPGLPGRSNSPKSEAPGRRQLKVQVSGARRWGLLGPFALSRGAAGHLP